MVRARPPRRCVAHRPIAIVPRSRRHRRRVVAPSGRPRDRLRSPRHSPCRTADRPQRRRPARDGSAARESAGNLSRADDGRDAGMRSVGIWAALLLMVTSPGQRAFGATPSDPFTIDRTGAERPATVALLPVTFRIEPSVDSDDHGGVVCPRWRAVTLVKASLDPTWQLVRSGETDGDQKVILHGIPGRTTLVVVECPGGPG